jgi:hypothetical protein
MRILKPTPGLSRAEAERRVALEMLCLEHGARAVGPDLGLLPPPHAPWPTVDLPPVTGKGAACQVLYRPTVGLVYYTLAPGDTLDGCVARLAAELEGAPCGDAHLRAARAAAATPATVLRHAGRVVGGHAFAAGRQQYKMRLAADKAGAMPSRLFQWTPEGVSIPPEHYSIRAAFTWVFMPATAALEVCADGFSSMAAVNAALASIYYDGAGLCALPDGAVTFRLTPGDFKAIELLAGPRGADILPHGGALLVTPGGALAFVGRDTCLQAPVGGRRPTWPPGQTMAALAAEPWAPAGLLLRGGARATAASRDFRCLSCDAPLGGEVVVVRAPRAPAANYHREWYNCDGCAAGDALLASDDGGLLLCAHCWDGLEPCLAEHLRARLSRTTIPYAQAEAAAAQGYATLAEILGGRATPLAPGAYVVAPAHGAPYVLASEKLGRYPAVACPAVAAAGLAVIGGLALAEVAHASATASATAPRPGPPAWSRPPCGGGCPP